MADNYIEKQQELYEARKAAWKQAQKYGKKKSATTHTVKSEQATETKSKAKNPQRRVFVTGGAEGIGKAIVEAFFQAGNRVAFCDINEVAGQQTAKETGAIFYQVDASDKDALENCMQQILKNWGDIDIIINRILFCESFYLVHIELYAVCSYLCIIITAPYKKCCNIVCYCIAEFVAIFCASACEHST